MNQHMPPEQHQRFHTFADVLDHRAAERPERTVLNWLGRKGALQDSWDFATLRSRARAVAAQLHAEGLSGQRVLLMFPPGLDFVAAFFGCLLAGVVAIPAYPPDPSRLQRSLPRFLALVDDSGARAVLTTAEVAMFAGAMLQQTPALRSLRLVAVDAGHAAPGASWRAPGLDPAAAAFIQYSSGSTARPKGIVVTHRDLLRHARLLQDLDNDQPGRSGLFWLPSYHDLGLIAGILQPVYYGVQTTLMSPIDFLKRPLTWLRAVSQFRPTHTGGPNFGYDLCVRRFDPAKLEGVDLSGVAVFVNAAERVRKETIDRFVETFAPYGVRPEQFGPAYGLAEATLVVSTHYAPQPPVCLEVEREALTRGTVVEATASTLASDRQWLVGVGQARAGISLAIVDPTQLTALPEGHCGEIWVHSPATASGYLNQPALTEQTFAARLPGDARPWLRTGDVGFLHQGQLFVTARLKDLVILRGRNIAPEDIERSVELAHEAVRPGCVAAFSVDDGAQERLVIALETRPGVPTAPVEAAIRERLAASDGLAVWRLVFLGRGELPKTSSGKVQRHAAHDAFCATLAAAEAQRARIEGWIVDQVARRQPGGVTIDRTKNILSYGIDSLEGVALIGDLEDLVGRELSPQLIFDNPSLTVLAERVARIAARPGV